MAVSVGVFVLGIRTTKAVQRTVYDHSTSAPVVVRLSEEKIEVKIVYTLIL